MTSLEQLTGHTTVQASAGSGKTYLLISRIVRLLLSGTEPGNILAITFTKKAANEMQTRLLERLYELANANEKQLKIILNDLHLPSSAAMLSLCHNLYEKVLRSESPVKTSTFHAFCQELLRRFPIEADISPGFDLLDKTAQFHDEAWELLMHKANKNTKSELSKSLDYLFEEIGLYNSKEALSNFIEHRSDWWAYTDNKNDPAEYAKKNLEKQLNFDSNLDPIKEYFNNKNNIALLSEFHVLICKHETKKNKEHCEYLYTIIDDKQDNANKYKLLTACFLTQSGTPLKRKESATAAKKMGEEGQQHFLQLHTTISNKILEIKAHLSLVRTMELNSAWYKTGQEYLDIFQKLKKEKRLLDFTDLEWQTYLLLNKSNNALWVQYKLDQRIEHLLVDEFQDTNPTQWHLILPLLNEMAAAEDERQRSVFIVGDPKQSIYRFRRAEPRLFTAAEKYLKDELSANTVPLSDSWRSSPAIINFVNSVFTQDHYKLFSPDFSEHNTHQKEMNGKVTILPLSKKISENEDNEKISHLNFRNPLNEPREEKINNLHFREGLLISNQIKSLIKNKTAINSKNGAVSVNYGDIIILLRSRTHVADYEKALRQSGIPYIGANRGALLESLEVTDMLDLLQWLILPFDNLSLAGILRSPLFLATNADLIEIKNSSKGNWLEKLKYFTKNNPEHKSLVRAYHLLTKWQEDASKLPVHDLLDIVYSEANVLARYAAAFPPHLSQRVTANLTRFLELALEMDSGRYPSLSRFSSWLSELRQRENEAPDEPVTVTSETEQRVRILSVHAAKGLEAPIIFLVDSARNSANNNAYSTLVDWPAEKNKPDYFLLTTAKKDLDKFSEDCIKAQDFFEQRETANLLYVAVTRAKQMLFISGSEPKSKDHGWYEKICMAYGFTSTENEDAVIVEEKGKEKTIENDAKTKIETSKTIPKELSLPLNMNFNKSDISPSSQDDFTIDHADSSEKNTLRGIIMHQMLNAFSLNHDMELSQFYFQEINELPKCEIEKYWNECKNIIESTKYSNYIDNSNNKKFYN